MIVSCDYKFVYMNIGKTGSITIQRLFEEEFNACVWEDWDKTARWPKCAPQHVCHLPEQFSDYTVIASIRDPFTHEMSRYTHGNKKNVSTEMFHKWLSRVWMETYHFKLNMKKDYSPPVGCVKYKVDHFIRLESIKEDIQNLPFVNRPIRIPHRNKTQNDQSKIFYTEELATLVRKGRAIDFETFGYSTDLPKEVRRIPCL